MFNYLPGMLYSLVSVRLFYLSTGMNEFDLNLDALPPYGFFCIDIFSVCYVIN